ncbi:MAG TPA: hypothetical protein VLU46_08415 [Thermoanaerobaculia bacterium]|nr:hypothetical protein [Thermoanaerobaculia bacterium]
MNAAYVHLVLNSFPPVLTLAGLCILVGGMSSRSEAVTRVAFAVIVASVVIAIATYVTGTYAQAIVKTMVEGVNGEAIEPHQEAATAALVFLILDGLLAAIALFVRLRRVLTAFVLILTIIATLTVTYAARLGGRIHHPEFDMRRPPGAAALH